MLWAIRVLLVVSTLYIIIAFGLTLAAWITGGLALVAYGTLFVKVQEAKGAKSVSSRGLIFSVAYLSVVNFGLGIPYRIGGSKTNAKIFWSFQILASIISLALILGYAFSVPELQAAYGCVRLVKPPVCPSTVRYSAR